MNSEKTKTPIAGDIDRAPDVAAMFDELAPKYDLGNRVLSPGLDQGWRRRALAALKDSGQGTVLDLCAGTDLTQMLVEHGAEHVHSVDFSAQMLAHGASKIDDETKVTIHCKDARELPLDDNSVDGIIAGFDSERPEVHSRWRSARAPSAPVGTSRCSTSSSRWVSSRRPSAAATTAGRAGCRGLITGFKDSTATSTSPWAHSAQQRSSWRSWMRPVSMPRLARCSHPLRTWSPGAGVTAEASPRWRRIRVALPDTDPWKLLAPLQADGARLMAWSSPGGDQRFVAVGALAESRRASPL